MAGCAANTKHFPVRDECASRGGTGLHRDRAHVPVIRAVPIGMMQAHVNAQVDFVILRIPPTRINDLIRVGRGVDRAVRNTVIHAIVPIIVDPIAETVGPVAALPGIANSCLWWRCTSGRRGGAIFARLVASVGKDNIIVGVIGGGMIENGFL